MPQVKKLKFGRHCHSCDSVTVSVCADAGRDVRDHCTPTHEMQASRGYLINVLEVFRLFNL